LLRDLSIGNSNEQNNEYHRIHHDHHHHHHHKRSVPNTNYNNNTSELKPICLNDHFYLKNFAKDGYFTTKEIQHLCPVLLQQIASKACFYGNDYYHHDNHVHHLEPQKERSTSKLTNSERKLSFVQSLNFCFNQF
jgi:hypothetical protein